MSVYVIEVSSGSFDSYSWWIGGICDDIELANQIALELNENAERVRKECPVQVNDDCEDEMTDEQEKLYWRYHAQYNNEMEWNGAVVKEYSLNQTIRK